MSIGTRVQKEWGGLMEKFLVDFGRALFWQLMNPEERLTFCGDSMIKLLTPEELERWAHAEQKEQDAKARIAELREKAKSRDLTGWRDKEDPEAEAMLNQLPAKDREFARLVTRKSCTSLARHSAAKAKRR
ncbi:MAG: hypothetical protein WB586_30410 [Chthoniobacterales bacterium]